MEPIFFLVWSIWKTPAECGRAPVLHSPLLLGAGTRIVSRSWKPSLWMHCCLLVDLSVIWLIGGRYYRWVAGGNSHRTSEQDWKNCIETFRCHCTCTFLLFRRFPLADIGNQSHWKSHCMVFGLHYFHLILFVIFPPVHSCLDTYYFYGITDIIWLIFFFCWSNIHELYAHCTL